MLVYRSGRRQLDVREGLSDLQKRLSVLNGPSSPDTLDEIRSLLIDIGELEAGLVDAECTDDDDETPLACALGGAIGAIAEMFAGAWRGAPTDTACGASVRDELRALNARDLPERVEVSLPEGFAYYGLFPEVYLEAAAEFLRARRPASVVVIGIRSIGTTLSAVVAAVLREASIPVERLTLRPRGHPFDRELRLSAHLHARLRALALRPRTLFAVVDEGPGLSGSSFASIVDSLAALGVADDRIVLFPSWNPDPRTLRNERARRVWSRHTKYVGDFDRVWLDTGRLRRTFGIEVMQDLSAGAWRGLFFESGEAIPAVQPQHERRKFLVRRGDGEQMLIKFEGLDRAARARTARARRVSNAGFAPPVEGFAHGFLMTRWIEASPVDARDIEPELLRRIAHYLAWNARCERSGTNHDLAPLIEMLRVNADEGLGHGWGAQAVRCVTPQVAAAGAAPAVRVDGHMFAHEWLHAPNGVFKSDASSHFDDHFYPGETDIAWDVAGAAIELGLDAEAERVLLDEYRSASGDIGIERRLRFMRPMYAAFRLGYTTLGCSALGESPDGNRLRAASRRYRNVLQRELSAKDMDDRSRATGAPAPA